VVIIWLELCTSYAMKNNTIVTSTSVILSSNKIQNGDILVPANAGLPGKMAVKWREGERLLPVMGNQLIRK